MKKNFLKFMMMGAVMTAFSLTGCNDDDREADAVPDIQNDRWVTVAGALMQTDPGDGNGGTMIYTVTRDQAINPETEIDVFENGIHVKSNRTARLQASNTGNFIYNIQYTGADGGTFNKYRVNGGANYTEEGSAINVSAYVGTSPRWVKAAENLGVAVNVGSIENIMDGDNFVATRGIGTAVALDLENPRITGAEDFSVALTAEEEIQGYHIWRLDAPVLNKAGNKLIIGTWMRKYEPGTEIADNTSPRLGTKSVVVDYPSLTNAKIITSTVATGDNSGYRSPMAYVATDGNIYQATHRERAGAGGAKILKINQNNEYDNTYVLSLDTALGVTDSYIETWRYAGNGIGYVIYSLVVDGTRTGGYIARVDLNARTAQKIDIPNDVNLDYGQYQGIAVVGEEVFIAVTPTGVNGNLYIFNSRTNTTTVGAKLINKTGNRYIGVY